MYKHPADLISELSNLEGAGSKKAKRALVQDYFDHEEGPKEQTVFYKVVRYALDPWFNFFVATIPGLAEVSSDARRNDADRRRGHRDLFENAPTRLPWRQQFDSMFALLDKLRNRDLPPNSSAAHAAVLEWARQVGPGTISVFRKIISKDLRCGMQASSFNGICPGWVPEFRLSLAQPFDESKLRFPCFVDPKFDGERCLAFVTVDGNDGSVSFISRAGNEHRNFSCFSPDMLTAFRGHGCIVVDCEVIHRGGFQSLQKVPTDYDPNFDASKLMAVVFDMIPQAAFNAQKYEVPQSDRYRELTSIFRNFRSDKVTLVDSRIARNMQELEDLFEYWVSQGLEGIIAKQPDGEYHFSTNSKRSPDWIKMKPVKSDDFEIVGLELGDSKKKWAGKAGSLIVLRNDPDRGPVKVSVAGGMTDYMHENIWESGDQILYRKPNGEVVNIKGKIVEVSYDNVTEAGSLRFPRIKARGDSIVRLDKVVAD